MNLEKWQKSFSKPAVTVKRKDKDHNRLKMLLKCYKRMNQGSSVRAHVVH